MELSTQEASRNPIIATDRGIMAAKCDKTRIDLRGVVYREGDVWIAHCLELDVVAEGDTPEKAIQDAVDLCVFQIETAVENNDLESVFRPAPSKFWTLFNSESAKRRPAPRKGSKSPVERFDVRELVLN
jgi:predicted RNase H-like HicB family nuclease